MPTTGLDIVTGALKRLRVIASDETASAADAADALSALNDMMFGLRLDNADAQWAEMELTSTFPLDRDHIEGVKAMLAVRIAEDFGKAPGPVLARDAQNGEDRLRADYEVTRPMKVDPLLRSTTSQRRYD